MLLSASTSHGTRTRRRAAWIATAALGVSLVLSGAATAPAALADTSATLSASSSVSAPTKPSASSPGTPRPTPRSRCSRTTSALVNGEFPASATTFSASGTANIASSGGYKPPRDDHGSRREPRTRTASARTANWSQTSAFSTQSFDGDYDFLFFGDPQIGSSGDVAKDQAGWQDTMNVAVNTTPKAECSSRVATRSTPPTRKTSGARSSPPTPCVRSRGSRRSETTTWAARPRAAPLHAQHRPHGCLLPRGLQHRHRVRRRLLVHLQGHAVHRPQQQQLRHLSGRRR